MLISNNTTWGQLSNAEVNRLTKVAQVTITRDTGSKSLDASSLTSEGGYISNPTFVQVPSISVGAVKPTFALVNEIQTQKIELLRDIISSDVDISNETIAAKMNAKQVKVEDQAAIITALDEKDAAAVQRLWLIATGEVSEASSLSRTVKLAAALDSFEESAEEQEFSADDFKELRKVFDKNKLKKDADKKVKGILSSMALLMGVREQLNELRSAKTTSDVRVPDEEVTLIINPKQNSKTIFAINENTFVVGKKGEEPNMIKGKLDEFIPQFPVTQADPVTSASTGNNQITLSNPQENASNIQFALGDEKKTLAVGATQSYPVPASGQITVYTTKTRSVSSGSGRRRSGSQSQAYQDSQDFPVTAGSVYDFHSEAENGIKLVTRPIKITIDNSKNPFPFHLNVGGQAVTIAPFESKLFDGENGALSIRFAQSENPHDTASFDFNESKTYKPAISKDAGKWSLFAADATIE
ncbi:hypothetical protein FACS189454_05280 [Planctomycetales bacterium]|nr:hypothetical protein FACS189454_05280 [Planctomycetales bacterium]